MDHQRVETTAFVTARTIGLTHFAARATVVTPMGDGELSSAQLAHGHSIVGDPDGRLLADAKLVLVLVRLHRLSGGGQEGELLRLELVDRLAQDRHPFGARLSRSADQGEAARRTDDVELVVVVFGHGQAHLHARQRQLVVQFQVARRRRRAHVTGVQEAVVQLNIRWNHHELIH